MIMIYDVRLVAMTIMIVELLLLLDFVLLDMRRSAHVDEYAVSLPFNIATLSTLKNVYCSQFVSLNCTGLLVR